MRAVLVVGAGFAGAVYARTLAEAGYTVHVIDQRDHIGGNAFDFVDANGIRVHRYGPHLFHTNVAPVFAWLQRFGRWTPYRHRVRAILPDGRLVPLPVNLDTINLVFGEALATDAEAEAFLRRIAVPIAEPRNAGEHLRARIGDVLTDLFFRPYTRKMWGLELEEMDASIVRRLPIRFDSTDQYFPADCYQALPTDGYTALFQVIFNHPAITLQLETTFVRGMERNYSFCFNSMAIDAYFDHRLGDLPYRSLRFHSRTVSSWDRHDISVRNYTDTGPFTREAWWHCLPDHLVTETGRRSVTVEEPCDYRQNNNERYYPVKTADGRYQTLYQEYRKLAEALPNMTFIGRCGTYQYLDMDQVINQSLAGARRWLAARG
ncbi:MAG: UDP-galactopyranose mutase [Rhodospirillales bacterium 20-64-7]|nr:MAG: UDP-galactopyranose mutase [Rhodospirillales bacterium 20-64-7]HQT77622.1 UDP-galactopyranose mutase [Rhodopila sp.]